MVSKVNKVKKDVRNQEKRPQKKSKLLKKVFLLLLIILVVVIGFIIYKVQANGGGLQGLLLTAVGHDQETIKELDPIQVLLMGVSTDNGLKLSDTIIVASYNPKTQQASLLSIPRDTFIGKNVKNGATTDKINCLYQKGPERTLEAVNELTGLDVKYYVVIDNQALIKLVDVIGGVQFDVPINMKYTDPSQDLYIRLNKGMQTIDGKKAEQLLRFRKNDDGTSYPSEYGDNDIGRMKTQRNFIIETIKQTIQAKNIFKIKDIIDIAYEYVDTNLSISTIKDYVPYAINVDVENMKSASLPGTSLGPPNAPYWFFVINEKETENLMKELYGTEDKENVTENTNTVNSNTNTNTNSNTDNSTSDALKLTKTETSKIKIELINGSGSSSKLTEIKKELTEKGYKISKTSSTTTTSKTTIINKTDIDEKFEEDIKNTLGVGNISSSSVSSSDVDITIIIGKDYK